MCIHPFKNWELNESLETLNDFTTDFTEIELDEKESIALDSEQEEDKK